jgi:hypothetical protein
MWRQGRFRKTNEGQAPRFTYMICWVEDRPALKVGKFVDFKDVEGLWEVTWLSTITSKTRPRQTWQVGGL